MIMKNERIEQETTRLLKSFQMNNLEANKIATKLVELEDAKKALTPEKALEFAKNIRPVMKLDANLTPVIFACEHSSFKLFWF